MSSETSLRCRCGKTQLTVAGAPILSAECLCDSCRQAGKVLQSLADAPAVLNDYDATAFVLYRKDRVRYLSGVETLREHRLTPTRKTRRVVATCCNTPIFLEFSQGHWLSLYSQLWPEQQRPSPQLRTMVSDLPDKGAALPKDLPNYRYQSVGFFFKLLTAWAAMGFRSPAMPAINGALDER